MKTLFITFVYNELNYLPHTLNYYKKNGCDVYILDNYSTDGTYEWLIENNIPCHRVDSNNAFNLLPLQKDLTATVHRLKPDWVIFGSADLYHITKMPISKYIEWIDSMGFNQLTLPCISAVPMSEEELILKTPLSHHHFNGIYYMPLTMISKYSPELHLEGDFLVREFSNPYITHDDGVTINYGPCKPVEVQEVKRLRVQKAWKEGMPNGYGVHYEKSKKMNWLFVELSDRIFNLKESKYWKFILKINED